MKAAVIGQPIAHSLSPAIFRFIRAREMTALDYEAREVSPSMLSSFLAELRNSTDWRGLNVTIPHKESVIPLLDEVSADAKSVGAVNVVQRKNGKLLGFNTDIIGIEKTFHYAGFSVRGKNCFVFGAGGSAKAVAQVLGESGAKLVSFYNPRSDRAQDLVSKFSLLFPETKFETVSSLESAIHHPYALVVNTTPVGMNIQDPIFFSGVKNLKLTEDALAFDLIYTPKDTLFLKAMRACGVRGVGGLGMLVDQALATWELWFGTLRNSERTREELLQYLSGILNLREKQNPVFLTGFMGVGKSTIALELSKSTGRSLYDSDRVVEKNAGLSVSDIFAQYGEAEFRKYERAAVLELCETQGSVIALGGGVLNDPKNLEQIKGSGTLVYLSASEKTLSERLEKGSKSRPLLANLSQAERNKKIHEMLKSRLPIYEQAHFMVAVDELRPPEAAEGVLLALGGVR